MKSFSIIFLMLFQATSYSQTYSISETSYSSDSVTLYADIYAPSSPRYPVTAIALVQGSGNSDRSNAWAASFATLLAENGYYVLFPDKRGSGKSGGDWKTVSFHVLARDAIASLEHLRTTINPERIGVVGLSQGGMIAPLVARFYSRLHFVVNIVGSTVTLEEQIIHEMMNTARKQNLQPRQIMELMELHVLMRAYAFGGSWTTLEKKIEELRSSSWAEFAKTIPSSKDSWIWNWIRLNLEFDPTAHWKHVTQDVFIAYGAKDQDDNMPVFESVYRLQKTFQKASKKNYNINVYPTGHALYEDDRPELRKEFKNDLLKWIEER